LTERIPARNTNEQDTSQEEFLIRIPYSLFLTTKSYSVSVLVLAMTEATYYVACVLDCMKAIDSCWIVLVKTV